MDNWVDADNPARTIDAYVDTLDLSALGFDLTAPNPTAAGQPGLSVGGAAEALFAGQASNGCPRNPPCLIQRPNA